MARVTIHDDEMYRSRLPFVCIRCGEPAARWLPVDYQGLPAWMLFFFPVAVVLLAISARVKAFELPVCDRHLDPRAETNRFRFVFLMVVLCGLIAWSVISLVARDFFCSFSIAWIVAIVGSIIVSAAIEFQSFRRAWTSPHSITLANVSPAFVDALEELRQKRLTADRDRSGLARDVGNDERIRR